MIGFKVKVDMGSIKEKVDKAVEAAQFALDEEVLKDSNFFAPENERNLIDSSIRYSKIGKGKLVWDTKYARRLYFNPQYHFSKDKNPNAQGLWFEAAKAKNKKHWEKVAQDAAKKML